MGNAEILEMAGGLENDAAQDETDWWMSEIHAEVFDNQKSAMSAYVSEVSSIGMKCGQQEGLVSGTGYVDSVDNVDKWQEEGWG